MRLPVALSALFLARAGHGHQNRSEDVPVTSTARITNGGGDESTARTAVDSI
jgi:hypothetical protein